MTLRDDPPAAARPYGTEPFAPLQNVFGLWTTERVTAPAEPAPASAAFDVGTAPGAGAEVLLWRMTLPADERLASERLDAAAAQLRAVDVALRQCEDRIATMVESSSRGVSFNVASAVATLPAAEQQLLYAIDKYPQPRQPVSFGLVGDFTDRWRQMAASLQSFMDRLARFTSQYAWVETEVGDKLIGRTVVGWSGDMHTVWPPSVSAVHAGLHEGALSVALGSRQRLIEALVTASRGAMLLATLPAMLATPLGAVAALPAAWQFVNQVVTLLDTPRKESA